MECSRVEVQLCSIMVQCCVDVELCSIVVQEPSGEGSWCTSGAVHRHVKQ